MKHMLTALKWIFVIVISIFLPVLGLVFWRANILPLWLAIILSWGPVFFLIKWAIKKKREENIPHMNETGQPWKPDLEKRYGIKPKLKPVVTRRRKVEPKPVEPVTKGICIWSDESWCYLAELEEITDISNEYKVQNVPAEWDDEAIDKYVIEHNAPDPQPSTMKICIWLDRTWCHFEEIETFLTEMANEYDVVDVSANWDKARIDRFVDDYVGYDAFFN